MKQLWLIFATSLVLLLSGCSSDHFAGRFEAHLKVDPETHQITGMDVITTKNYGNINASGTIDPKTQMPVFNISAENVDATSMAAIVAKSNSESTKNILGIVTTLAGGAVGVPVGP
jgi:PBP1b-binding outer membrane lipoprotein LpoB